ncbi:MULTISPECIES: tRNA (guanosine(37)-N1)-methyltransferase TrmD [Ruminococcus]|uniref:tRNA (guanine-N(1)-)-methyltransferase n=1 Tax=Ruminococcus albus 8 TaxID=246199 RepID=E9SGZ1_RUMAL|nr:MULTISPECIES: tRNA (guanosine(37)-N1)-methyltransferase TrmD [Ruminococcus]MBE6873393.1 tRNA (guanosine(37)-N1)-methyltransferase TrmD [Ruminococcus albus]EGC01323.1 tRNA (guanine-N(1)-)-methyltransferase [Ruminococcus albus 8]MBO5558892.1 tRNA (guanosine(37)-N1)-methyltransferase TrmD [Ruminococcus sp.]MBQ9542026.1 tRNA (guanosine(37)-N1)-methyltransferase TrmD [Ruminococcus sp.]MBR0530786.1 tRNA (guanosine(37)-N1)-methyltransferase TrmD [Ruminococcus sp.]
MNIDIATLFPEMLENYLSQSIVGRARAKDIFTVNCHDIRAYTKDKHRRVDDTPYSEQKGMLMQCDPIFNCFEAVTAGKARPHVIYMSPQGKTLTQQRCKELAQMDNIFILCGHYEGVDERIIETLVDEEISIGDYVLTGGELPALVLVDAVVRMLDGTLSQPDCYQDESHYSGLLEYPQYTRPEVWHDMRVPEILLSGHHANIAKWRHEQALIATAKKRPELLEKLELTAEDLSIIHKVVDFDK